MSPRHRPRSRPATAGSKPANITGGTSPTIPMPVPVLYSHDKDSLDEMDSGLPPPPPTKGTILDSHLQLTSVLGEGGFSTVFLARSLIPSAPSPPPRRSSSPARKGTKTLPRSPLATGSGNSLVAVKLLLTPPAHLAHVSPSHAAHTSPTQKSLHLREISLHSLVLPHPSIVPLHKILFHNTYIALVMPYFPRGDLFTAILNDSLFLGRPSAVKDVYLQILDAVGHCHSRGVYMRDLKPENILVDYDPAQKTGPIKIFLTDFGLATSDVESTEFRTGSMYHMSPECMGPNPYSPQQNDIWSLGILLLNLITSRNPWRCADAEDVTFCAYVDSCNPRPSRRSHAHSRGSEESALSSSSSVDSMKSPDRAHTQARGYTDSAGGSILLPHILPISSRVNQLLLKILHLVPLKRPSVMRLKREIETFGDDKWEWYSQDVVFESGCARCGWEAEGGALTPESPAESRSGSMNDKEMQMEFEEDGDGDATLVVGRCESPRPFSGEEDSDSDSECEYDPEKVSAPPSPRSAWSEDSTGLHEAIPPMPTTLSPNIAMPVPVPAPAPNSNLNPVTASAPSSDMKKPSPTSSPVTNKSRIPRRSLGSLRLPGSRSRVDSLKSPSTTVDDTKTPTNADNSPARPTSPSPSAKDAARNILSLRNFHFKGRSTPEPRPTTPVGNPPNRLKKIPKQNLESNSNSKPEAKSRPTSPLGQRRGLGILRFPLPVATPPSTSNSTSSSDESGSFSPGPDDEMGFVSASSSFGATHGGVHPSGVGVGVPIAGAGTGAMIGPSGYPKTPKDGVFDPASLTPLNIKPKPVLGGGDMNVKVVDPHSHSQLSLSSSYYTTPSIPMPSPTSPGFHYQSFSPISKDKEADMDTDEVEIVTTPTGGIGHQAPHLKKDPVGNGLVQSHGQKYTKRLFGRSGTFGLFGKA